MDKLTYESHRSLLVQRLLAIPSPKFFPRSVRKILLLIANLDAEYSGETQEKCYQQLATEFNIKIKEK